MTSGLKAADSHICSSTKLSLVHSPSDNVHRIGKTEYGPINPLPRGSEPNRTDWGRWDTAGGRTLYLGSTATAAFAEALPYGRENLPKIRLADYFDDLEDDEADRTLADKVLSEMPSPTMRNVITRIWMSARTHWEIKLPEGWFVDIHTAESLAAVNNAIIPNDDDVERLTTSDLTGDARHLTTRIAEWVRTRRLFDGSEPMGIRYPSKHGSNLHEYALWLRALDDGKPLSSEPARVVSHRGINRSHPDLQVAAGWHGLRLL